MCPRQQTRRRKWVHGALKLGGYACVGLVAMTVMVPFEVTRRVTKRAHRGYCKAKEPFDHREMVEALHIEAPTPPPGPTRRLLPATVLPSKSTPEDRPAPAQLQSPLFRLPLEVREIIWEYTVGHRFVYQPQPKDRGRRNPATDQRATKKTRVLCPGRTEYIWTWPREAHIRAPWVRTVFPGGSTHPAEGKWNRKQAHYEHSSMTHHKHIRPASATYWYHEAEHWTGLDLLVTCRRIAEEVRPFIFRNNTFSFSFLEHLQVFRAHVGTSMLANIRYLHLDLLLAPGPYLGAVDRHAWEELWRLVPTEMPALRELDLEVHLPNFTTLGLWLGWRHTDGIVATHFRDSLPDWVDSLATLQGRLRRARLICDSHYYDSVHASSDSSLPEDVQKIQDRLIEMQAAITMSGTGGWMELDPWQKHLEWRNKNVAVELESNNSPASGNVVAADPSTSGTSSDGNGTALVPDAAIWDRWMRTSPSSLAHVLCWDAAITSTGG